MYSLILVATCTIVSALVSHISTFGGAAVFNAYGIRVSGNTAGTGWPSQGCVILEYNAVSRRAIQFTVIVSTTFAMMPVESTALITNG
jgi:hypothetical protein